MNTLKISDMIRDNDPRVGKRVLKITDFAASGSDRRITHAVCESKHRENIHIRIDRIHTDGKPRRSGFSLVKS